MESSDSSMDDSFRARVQKAFGSLSSSQSPWSLTDDEIEKREWSRGRGGSTRDDDATPCSSSFDGLSFPKDRKKKKKNSRLNVRRELGNDLKDPDDDDDGDGDGDGDDDKDGSKRGDGDDGDEWEIRSSIGMDCTLDNEDEEDEYDKVAEGRENAGDRLFMKDVTDHGPYLNSHNVLPSSVRETPRDPRANHLAARIRLKEDEVEAQEVGLSYTREKLMSDFEEPHMKTSENGGKPKSILKRKHDAVTSKEQKRVKFDPGCKDNFKEASENSNELLTGTPSVETTVSDGISSLTRNPSRVPDYVLNPSKYTRYSFDSASEVDDKSNSQVCMDFLKLVKMSKPEESRSLSGEASSPLPKPVTFIPRKKATPAEPIDSNSVVKPSQNDSEQSSIQTGFPLGLAAGETQSDQVNDIEDEPETNAADTSTGFQKPCRQYRNRSKLDDPVT